MEISCWKCISANSYVHTDNCCDDDAQCSYGFSSCMFAQFNFYHRGLVYSIGLALPEQHSPLYSIRVAN